jgi:NADPH-dependent ferric siderophore reductase
VTLTEWGGGDGDVTGLRAALSRTARPEAAFRVRVRRREWLTPTLVRVVFEGPALASFPDNGYADRCVRLVFPAPGVHEAHELPAATPGTLWRRPAQTVVRTYTVRSLDLPADELTIDFVVHGSAGVAGPWAATARPEDEIVLLGPRGSYAPRDDVDGHVLIGDETVLPAIALTCERVAPGLPVHVFAEVDGAADEIALESLGDLTVHWVHRGDGVELPDVVRRAAWPGGRIQAFVHGESGAVRSLRRYVLDERGVDGELLSSSGYWRRGADAEQFQADRRAELRGRGTRRP